MTWYSKIAAVVLGVVIFALGIYIGAVYQKGKDALEWSEQLRINRPIPRKEVTIHQTEKQYEYVQEGNIKNNATGSIEADDWVLIYEKSGSPALIIGLVFMTNSRCATGAYVGLCNTAMFEQGQRVKVMGHPDTDGKVIVERMEIVQ